MSDPGDFVGWATDPARSGDELFTVELLIERMRHSLQWPFRERALDFDEQQKIKKERRFNPAYRPVLARDELEALQECPDTVTHFASSGGSDRPLRDLTALGFFPALDDINISGVDPVALSALAALPKVQGLTLMEQAELGRASSFDFAQLGAKPALHRAHLSLRQPWPDLTALASWPVLQDLNYNGNLLALAEVGTLPAAEFVRAQKWIDASTPLRNLRTFPALPKVKRLNILPTASLAGIERYPTVLNLEIGGDFVDLAPLEALENVTFLQLTGEYFTDLAPLTRLPKLREFVFGRERPASPPPPTPSPPVPPARFRRLPPLSSARVSPPPSPLRPRSGSASRVPPAPALPRPVSVPAGGPAGC